ncbi:hypothetical protein NKH77_44415 [Streptomyces sp. M19]
MGPGVAGPVRAVPVCGRAEGGRPEPETFLAAAASAWTHGHALDWDVLTGGAAARRVPLPVYPSNGAGTPRPSGGGPPAHGAVRVGLPAGVASPRGR